MFEFNTFTHKFNLPNIFNNSAENAFTFSKAPTHTQTPKKTAKREEQKKNRD